MKITAVADEKTCTWLRMAGVKKLHPITDPKDAGNILRSLLRSIEYGIVLITPEVSKTNPKIMKQALEKKEVYPIFLELPVGESAEEAGASLQKLITSALGIDFKLS